ncbi:related to GABA transport protein [Serendipita indica DSM 11827]|uniref:Related to GABA transport protein n=1 Tax=Serendipita indica (strain DSM 11827) TaxID=1109443 RepID=G4TPI7_SERID|nr:related to GABA transport protein [Serendipita indica DSM 11827]
MAESEKVGVASVKDQEAQRNETADEAELAKLGYKQELKRDLTLLQNFGVSFSIISIITGIPSLFFFGLTTGGPAVMVWGWIVVSAFTLCVGAAMAEICSAHPTSGGPYFWSAKLSTPSQAPLAAWITGWFNLIGQVAVTTGISFACATFLSTTIAIGTSAYEPNPKTVIGIYAAVLTAQGLINTFGVHLLKYFNNISIWWHAFGTSALVISVLAKAKTHQTAKFVFTEFYDGTGWAAHAGNGYVICIGILIAQYTLTGFDASAHMTEETTNAATAGSWGIIMSIGVSAVLGWFLILGLLFSIQDYEATIGAATGQPVAQIIIDAVGPDAAIALMVIIVVAMFFCGTFSITSNSRMMYAFSRDGALPASSFFHKVDVKRKSPIRTVWLACTLSFILALPSLGSTVAFAAATSIATIGLYISYGIPILLRVLGRKRFVKGPWHLGKFSILISTLAVVWIALIAILFILPQVYPVTSQTLNYSIVAVGIVMAYAMGTWLLSARKWFEGPRRQIALAELGIDVMEPGAVEKARAEGKLDKLEKENEAEPAT